MMMNFVVLLLIITIALGTLFFMIGYGALFFGAFSHNTRVSLILLILLGFSSVGFVAAGWSWYYALPLWLIPVAYAHLGLPNSRSKRRAMWAFWGGLLLLLLSLGLITYVASENADIKATLEQFREQKMTEDKASKTP